MATPQVSPSLPAAKLTADDVANVKKLPRVLINIMERIGVKKGDKGDPGRPGKDGMSIKGPKGEKGDKGEPGKPGRDGRDGGDGKDGSMGMQGPAGRDGRDANPKEMGYIAVTEIQKAMREHLEKFDHDLIHDSLQIGPYTVDMSTIADKKWLRFDDVKKMYVFDFLPKQEKIIQNLHTGGNNDSDLSKSITITDPGASEDLSMFFANDVYTITKIIFVLTGNTSITATLRHGPDRNATGTEIVTGGTLVNSKTTGNIVQSFNSADIASQDFVWLETTAMVGIPASLHCTVYFRRGS